MVIITTDNQRIVEIGTSTIMFSLYSTVKILLRRKTSKIKTAKDFLKTGNCDHKNAIICARELNLVRDFLSRYSPEKAIWDCNDLSALPPWYNNLSPVITSCANLFTTADGKDLLYELVSVLTYAGITGCSVESH